MRIRSEKPRQSYSYTWYVKSFNEYIRQQRKIKEAVLPQMSETGDLLTTDMKKTEVLNNISASASTSSCSYCTSQVTESQGRDLGKEIPPLTLNEPE